MVKFRLLEKKPTNERARWLLILKTLTKPECSDLVSRINFLRMRVFEYSTKALGNQVIDQILESSNTQKNLVYSVLSPQ